MCFRELLIAIPRLPVYVLLKSKPNICIKLKWNWNISSVHALADLIYASLVWWLFFSLAHLKNFKMWRTSADSWRHSSLCCWWKYAVSVDLKIFEGKLKYFQLEVTPQKKSWVCESLKPAICLWIFVLIDNKSDTFTILLEEQKSKHCQNSLLYSNPTGLEVQLSSPSIFSQLLIIILHSLYYFFLELWWQDRGRWTACFPCSAQELAISFIQGFSNCSQVPTKATAGWSGFTFASNHHLQQKMKTTKEHSPPEAMYRRYPSIYNSLKWWSCIFMICPNKIVPHQIKHPQVLLLSFTVVVIKLSARKTDCCTHLAKHKRNYCKKSIHFLSVTQFLRRLYKTLKY